SASSTSNGTPNQRRSCRRRGDADASTSTRACSRRTARVSSCRSSLRVVRDPAGMWGRVGGVVCLVLVAACARAPFASRAPGPTPAREPLAAALGVVTEDPDRAARLLAEAAEIYPPLDDYALFFTARAERRAGRGRDALEKASAVSARHPDSI